MSNQLDEALELLTIEEMPTPQPLPETESSPLRLVPPPPESPPKRGRGRPRIHPKKPYVPRYAEVVAKRSALTEARIGERTAKLVQLMEANGVDDPSELPGEAEKEYAQHMAAYEESLAGPDEVRVEFSARRSSFSSYSSARMLTSSRTCRS